MAMARKIENPRMIQASNKKLIEVAIPLEAINVASAREKSIRHGHPSTLHLWWARRPLAACRAVLFAQLVDDPSSHPDMFPTEEAVDEERKRLFKIIEELVVWENSTNEEVLQRARAEIRKSCGEDLPPVYDPFSGGGSIPLEAQRLGLPAYGSDLNPVAVMIGKAMIEIPPKFKDREPVHPGGKERNHYRNADGLAEDVEHFGEWMREQAFERIGHLYPQVDLPKEHGGGKATVIAWIWSRTVPSPDPAFEDVQVPIASSFLLSSKVGKEAWIEPIVDKAAKTISYRIRTGGTKEEIGRAKRGTKAGRAVFKCLFSDAPISGDYIDKHAQAGRMCETMIAVVAQGMRRRIYTDANQQEHFHALENASKRLTNIDCSHLDVSSRGTWASNAQGRRYKFFTFKDYFTDRQLVALSTFSDLVHEARAEIERDGLAAGLSTDPTPLREGGTGAKAYAEAVSVYLAFAVDRSSDAWSAQVTWRNSVEASRSTFARQGIPMVWDYVELNPFSNSNGNWSDASIDWVQKSLRAFCPAGKGKIEQCDAQTVDLPQRAIISTDPPYYDNISYADLSDFFFCWMKPALRETYPDLFGILATPKSEELIATPYRHDSKADAEAFFLDGMSKAIANMVRQSSPNYPVAIYYAFKQNEIVQEGISSTGWATFLQAVLEAGYAVVGTWPMRTEKPGRMISVGTNALANSVVLVCRKREVSAEIISRAEFVGALKRELPPAIEELQKANISPADMPQSAIGPGMGVFSRCKAVLEADDSPMTVKTALQLINRELDDYLGGIQGEFDADTRFAITWFEQNGLAAGDYGSANSIATARGISVESVKHAGIVESAAGKVRIIRRDEIDAGWDPADDAHLTVWECCQHLVRELEHGGEQAAALLLRKVGPAHADAAKDLAYCLYDICANKRRNAGEAASYNGLIAVWSELTRQAAAIHDTRGDLQGSLEL